jgi:hypothetical protein
MSASRKWDLMNRMIQRSASGFAAFMLLSCCLARSAAAQALTPNTRYFSVASYYVPDASGNYRPYQARGFYEPGSRDVEPQLFLLPTITAPPNVAKFFRDGKAVDPKSDPKGAVHSITISLAYSDVMPDERQRVGIGSSLSGVSAASYLPEAAKNVSGQPLIYQPAAMNPEVVSIITAVYKQADEAMAAQRAMADVWRTYRPQSIPMTELSITLTVAGREVASRQFHGAMTGAPQLYVTNPSRDVVAQISNDQYEILLNYRFMDSKVSLIEATIDAGVIIKNYLKETQTALTENRSLGVSVFNIGFRRSRIKQSFSHTVQSESKKSEWASTRIVMTDATDDMVRDFEEAFFPRMKIEEVISNHFSAAERAGAAGDEALRNAHLDYARALQAKDQLKEADSVAAAAALAAGNYAMFVAEGVRGQLSDDKRSSEFRRVITNDVEIRKNTDWKQARRFSVEREISAVLSPAASTPQRASLGILSGGPLTYRVPAPPMMTSFGPQPMFATKTGFLITLTSASGPATLAGLMPGMIIDSIDDHPVTSLQSFDNELNAAEPGREIPVRVLDGTRVELGGAYQVIMVTPRAGSPSSAPRVR